MRHFILTAAASVAAAATTAGLQSGTAGGALTIDALVAIKHPSHPSWSPDGRRIAFVWDAGGAENVWVVNSGGGAPVALTRYDAGLIDNLFWLDANTLAFTHGGRLWRVQATAGDVQALWSDGGRASAATLSPDGTRVALERDGDIWVRSVAGGSEVRLTHTPEVESGAVWSPDSKSLAFTVATAVRHEEAPDYVGAKLWFAREDRGLSDVEVVAAGGGTPVTVAPGPDAENTPSWVDATHLALQRVSKDLRTREILVGNTTTGEAHVVGRDVDDKWWSLAGSSRPVVAASPDGRWVAFLSDRDGWDHLYVVRPSGGQAVQMTEGSYEVRNLAWSPDSTRIAFDANQGANPDSRQVAIARIGVDAAAGSVEVLTSGRGTNIEPAWSADGQRIVYQHTDPTNSADLFVTGPEVRDGSKQPVRLTDSFPSTIDRSQLVAPQLVRYPASDGSQVPASLFVPKDLDRSRKYPAIVWVHGDGTNQNYDGWHVQRNYAVYYSFHQYLVQHGYVVLAVDYRGSIGYGKAWRQGHYRDLGGKDYEDVAAGVSYLRTLGYVDPDRVGIWGLSYGGFMTLQGLTVTPELFRCGIDVAGVDDWADWYKDPDGPWIKGRMGSPAENPEIYRRSAPIYRVDRIVRPLLVLAGTADVNVPFLESVRLIDALLKDGKNVDFMMYPGEFHYFQRAHVLRDAWSRVERFFDAHLKARNGP